MGARLELVIFDADGVLFESAESNTAYYNAILKELGEPPLCAEEERAAIFMAASQVFALRANGDQARIARMHEIGRSLDFIPFFKLLRTPFPLRPFLMGFKPRYRLALATNRSATIPALIEYLGLGDLFDAVASARDKVPPKPAPDILTLCLKRAGVKPEAAVYVGDSPFDQEAAAAAGVHFIGVGKHLGCPSRVDCLADVPAALERLIDQ